LCAEAAAASILPRPFNFQCLRRLQTLRRIVFCAVDQGRNAVAVHVPGLEWPQHEFYGFAVAPVVNPPLQRDWMHNNRQTGMINKINTIGGQQHPQPVIRNAQTPTHAGHGYVCGSNRHLPARQHPNERRPANPNGRLCWNQMLSCPASTYKGEQMKTFQQKIVVRGQELLRWRKNKSAAVPSTSRKDALENEPRLRGR